MILVICNSIKFSVYKVIVEVGIGVFIYFLCLAINYYKLIESFVEKYKHK